MLRPPQRLENRQQYSAERSCCAIELGTLLVTASKRDRTCADDEDAKLVRHPLKLHTFKQSAFPTGEPLPVASPALVVSAVRTSPTIFSSSKASCRIAGGLS